MQIAFKSWDFAFRIASAGMILMNTMQTDVHYRKEMISVYFFLPLNIKISVIHFFLIKKIKCIWKRHFITLDVFKKKKLQIV